MSSSPTSSWSTAGTGSCQSCGSGTHGPRKRETGPMSRCSSLYQALANASANSSGFSMKRREIFSYAGSCRSARSVVAIIGACLTDGSCASGTASAAAPSLGFHCLAPAGLSASSHSKPKRVSKKLLSHVIGVGVQAPSRPLVIVSLPLPLP